MYRFGPWRMVAVLAVASGCLRTTSHQCETSDQCGPAGLCEPNGACSFPADDCPSGRRYGEGTGPLAGQCVSGDVDAAVPPDDDAAAPDGTPDDAPPPGPFYGDQRDGNLTTGNGDARVNTYATLVQDAPAGATQVMVVPGPQPNLGTWPRDFAAGDVVMVFQAAGAADPPASGGQDPLVLDGSVGRYHVTRLTAVNLVSMTLADPLPAAFAALETQIIKLPQFARVTVNPGGRLRPAHFADTATGGVVGFYADELILDGATVDADSRGFRGGALVDQPDRINCNNLDGTSVNGGGAPKGESVVRARYGTNNQSSGRGNIFSGGGGGNCHNAGGGGGGGASPGGRGGDDRDDRAVGGLPGVGVHIDPRTHLFLGGGAGAGEVDTEAGTAGGDGGGVEWIQVRTITCSNGAEIRANGDSLEAGGGIDGSGGGGGGGVIWIRTDSITGCRLEAHGGTGGSSQNIYGPGGGGGGGRIILAAGAATGVSFDVRGGSPGSGNPGATAGTPGAACGNGMREANETCDDGNTVPDDGCTTCSE